MRGVNKVILIGNATRDAELRKTQSGKSVCSFGLATNRMVRKRDGQPEELTQFHQVVCWATLADIVGRYVKKGRALYVEGRLEYQTFEEGDGTKRGVAEMIASDVHFLGAKPGEREPEAVTEDVPVSVEEGAA